MSSVEKPADDTCYRWSRDFAVAHAIFCTGLITLPVAVLYLAKRQNTGGGAFFAVFAVFFVAVSLTLCCRFYAELKRPPWPRWLSAASTSAGSGDETSTTTSGAVLSHDLRHPPGQPVMTRVESYEHCSGGPGGSAADDCAVCLGEVEKVEAAGRQPACRHLFHMECSDMWLSTQATCPVCRPGEMLALERPREVVVDIEVVRAQPGATTPAQSGMIFAGQVSPVL